MSLSTRLSNHISNGRMGEDSPKAAWIRQLLAVGLLPTLRVVAGFDKQADALLHEAKLIESIGCRRRLCNRLKNYKRLYAQ